MSPLLRGSRGASRKAREGARSMAALGVAQLLGFLAYSVLVFLLLLVARYKGFEIDGLLDGILAPLTGEGGDAAAPLSPQRDRSEGGGGHALQGDARP